MWPFLCLALMSTYGMLILRCRRAWNQLKILDEPLKAPPAFFSIIIAVRNEAAHILALLQNLEQQDYLQSHFEVIVVDDHSEDATADLVQQFAAKSNLNIQLLFLASFPEKRQKKAAIEVGIAAAKGDWILLTDGDCRVTPKWIASFNQLRHQQKPKLISGPVVLAPTKGVFQNLQALEFAALIGVGAASIALQKPNMCNGANIAYEKAAFYAVNGFAGNEQVASGDDEFLMHKIHQQFPGQIAFLKSPNAVVQTSPRETLTSFMQQRVRWASKWKHYQVAHAQILALLVLGANLGFLSVLVMSVLGQWSWWFLVAALLAKLLPDFLFLSAVLSFFEKKKLISLIGLLQLVYVPYILLTGLRGLKGAYQWKGRQIQTHD